MTEHTVDSIDALRAIYGEPNERAARKELPQLDKHCRNFIAASPFLVIGTAGADGRADCSPRGDGPGFVTVIDDKTLVIPDRLGNNRVDTLGNIVENPQVGLIFFLPGMNETLRVNGRAEISCDPALLAPLAVRGKIPRSVIVVHVEQAYLHCAKALIRSRLWDPETQIERRSFPSLGRILADQIEGLDPAETEASIDANYVERLY